MYNQGGIYHWKIKYFIDLPIIKVNCYTRNPPFYNNIHISTLSIDYYYHRNIASAVVSIYNQYYNIMWYTCIIGT